MINQERLWHRIMALSKIGRQPSGGITRLSFSTEERQAKDLIISYMKEAGLSVREDAVGNLIGKKTGKNPEAPIVLTGSHVDSVYNGGNFDGPLGVIAAVEALQTMAEQEIVLEHSIEVVAFTDEEGARFSFGMMGSRGMAGTLKIEDLHNNTDVDGITIAEAMGKAGFNPDKIGQAVRHKDELKAYVELHIEQGKLLENADLSVGVVTGIAGPLWKKFIIEGEAGHAGTTPMTLRHDALTAAAQIIQIIETEAAQTGSTVGTVGQLQLTPGGINIIPGRVEFTLDLRDIDETVRDRVEQAITSKSHQICEERQLTLTIEEFQRIPPVACSPIVQDAAKKACEKLGFGILTLPSGAGHDGMQLAELCDIGMIFARSKDGISHTPAEWSSKEDCANATNVLYHTLIQLAE
ncbi:Zn-dependent hydrolase [Ammoniphilus oxalaticus]|uniref:Zn-dependent hydrolase n=1 Tax=Ammoniphilus oxalaticus TaxID=66863 RepID=A0A419SLR8_9BACL|nr:Zn-dependent hydrolase [Ammoniphilus oxalaticus]RKD25008.1 Zn-dependent hydrolase [Ammoniphilus oxalaticus]